MAFLFDRNKNKAGLSHQQSVKEMMDLLDHPTLGILRLDYDYPASPGDIDHPQSFKYPVVYRVVPGFTFQMVQAGEMTDEVAKEFDEAVRWLSDVKKVSAITGDCGFMMWFEQRARAISNVPVFISSLMQLPTISGSLCKENDKIMVVTANVKSLRPMQEYINQTVGALEEDMHFVYVGCEDVPHFGNEVENGLQVDVAKAEPGILAKIKHALEGKPAIKAILLECTELPPYASAIRAATGLPVYDSITNCDFVMNAFLEDENFGLVGFYKKWDGNQQAYSFGQHLTPEQRAKLVSKPVCENCMHHMMDEIEKTDIVQHFQAMGLNITAEQAAHAIAMQVEENQIEDKMNEMKEEMKSNKKRFKRFRDLFSFGTKK